MNLYATEENLRKAVRTLIASPQILEVRLADAYRHHLANIAPETLPDDLFSLYQSIRERLTQEKPLEGESQLMASICKMTVDEAVQLAMEIYELQRRFSAWYREQVAWQPVGSLQH